ncbi:hypothetical protein DACRYDRAFT_98436 [Dacryopinax primogenitus]|uniref:DUF6593 domain-containing protein n=1 Tax=Dacryopinax primogenitus (strain DJM 731) TaxID=1858805 RepID=M5GGQ3_DACPD|nr:uncharacterized protein DACRYDRAFT_98436 [Dacryopinax primogenitus]EJU05888.1 hypothetical protein DACRYDRAFT_98436 [Dacryopinax primogenitus]
MPSQQSAQGAPLGPSSSRQGSSRVARSQPDPIQRSSLDPLGLSIEDQVLRPLAYELVLSSSDLGNTALLNRHDGAPPWFEVHTLVVPVPTFTTTPPDGDVPDDATKADSGVATRRIIRIRRRPHHRQPNDSDVLCLLCAISDADRDMTIQFPGQQQPIRVRKFFKQGLINSDVFSFSDARGQKWEWRERRYGYDFSLHEADKPDWHVIARYTHGTGTNNRPYLEYTAQGHLMLDFVVATFFALENSLGSLSARPSVMRALSRVGSILRSPGTGEGSRNTPNGSEELSGVVPEPLLPSCHELAQLRGSTSISNRMDGMYALPEPRHSLHRQRE